KPNLVATPTDRLSGGVTRWEVCMAIYEMVEAIGATPIFAESSACGVNTEDVIKKCGYQDLRDQGIPFINLKDKANDGMICTMPMKHGTILQSFKTWELVRDADAIITVPVLKTHDQTEITLGMKNLKGLLCDVQKKEFHTKGLVDSVCDLVETLKPCLEIIDGTYGQQGLGPIYGETRKMDLIIGSKDLVACETVAGLIMGYEPEEVMITKKAYERGLGEMDIDKITVVGKQIDEVKSRFKRTSEVEIEGLPASCNVIFDYQACTGCHNTVISSLFDMKGEGLMDYLENMNIVVGPVKPEALPEGANTDNTVAIGLCAKKTVGDALGLRWAVGCPPNNATVVQAILGDRREYGTRYASKDE
ncbi:MAG: DUF362 domain-containing protein, partial [Firmicutes bacterium]|nr:DUF362 domain-containing protein [Bacillota bacterium]